MENNERIRRPTPEYTNSPAHKFINSPPKKTSSQELKSLSFILQRGSNFHSVLAKIWAKK